MSTQTAISEVTERILDRSAKTRDAYLGRMKSAALEGPRRAHLDCGNLAHAYAAMGADKEALAGERAPNVGIVTAYNDMLSAHQPFEGFPGLIKEAARGAGATAQVAGGVPAMCDGVTQGQVGMELSLFSRDVIALSACVALSHSTFDAAIYLGVCDKIVPGLVMAATAFGHVPGIFLPAGPMTTGLPNKEKIEARSKFAKGEIGRDELMRSEMASYHGAGTCTFYGTANSNQMLMEFMGLHLPGASFVNPGTPLRDALTACGTRRALEVTALGSEYTPIYEILDERAYVNGIAGLMATGGSTNLLLHLIAMARAGGILLDLQDFADISDAVPVIANVYPNGFADVNHFHAAGGLALVIRELLGRGLLHPDTRTIMGGGLELYTREPFLEGGEIRWRDGPSKSENDKIIRTGDGAFRETGGIRRLSGNLGTGVMKTSAISPDRHEIEAPARVFDDQDSVKRAFKAGELNRDVVVVVRRQGPKSNGMPELHSLTPTLSVVQDRGHKVALVTDGRMSGASGKVPSAIHVTPEAGDGGLLAKLRDGDVIRVDAGAGTLDALGDGIADREDAPADTESSRAGTGRELFEIFRRTVSPSAQGASVIV